MLIKKKTRTVFLDMDGVMADFVGAALSLHNFEPELIIPAMKGSYQIEEHLNITPTEFWAEINKHPNFWSELEKTVEADHLINYLENKIDTKDIFFLSSPSQDPYSHYGKANWVKTHYPRYITRLILTNHKHFFAGQNRILIDDSDSNCQRFKDAGGQVCLVPRPWNKKHTTRSEDVLDYTIRELNRML